MDERPGTKIAIVSIVLLAVVGVLMVCRYRGSQAGASTGVVTVDSGTIMRLGTFARIKVRCTRRQAGLDGQDAALRAIDRIDRLMSTYREDSELSRVNRLAGQQAVPVSRETFELLSKALEYSRQTDGAFDITVTAVLQTWKQAARQLRVPTPEELSRAREKVGYEKVLLRDAEPPMVEFAVDGVRLNVDAIAKGYAVDEALQAMRLPEVVGAMVDIGGEIACFETGRTDHAWNIGIQDPFVQGRNDPLTEAPRWKVQLRNRAIATSGNYRQYVVIDGTEYSHIVDPRSGMPAGMIASVTIMAPKAVDADALATAVSVMGVDEGMNLIESLEGVEALLVAGTPETPQVHRSTGFRRYEAPMPAEATGVSR
jgi:thiamine biosynthesis lipoprotein